ncbi:MAG TPA: PepSY-associated TM helix domain-containing protein [Abditibacteriaceae bacterium]|jgi:uncharacterized iron-regulated membrane protein
MRKLALWLHRWIGLSVALVAVISGVTGAALVFRPEIEARFDNLMRVEISSQTASLQNVISNAQQKFPDAKVNNLFMAREPSVAHVVWMKDGDVERRVYVNPANAQVLGTRVAGENGIERLAEIHIRLMSGDFGHSLIGWGGVALFSMSCSGLILWWPRGKSLQKWRRAFRPEWKNPRGRNYEGHRVGGAVLAPLLMLASFSGMALVWPETAQGVLKPFFGETSRPKYRTTVRASLPLDDLVTRANAAFPEGVVRRIAFPAKPGAALVIRKKRAAELHPNGMNYVYLDAATGKVLGIDDASRAAWGTRLMNARYPVHIGLWGGTATRVLAVVVGLAPLAFFISGFILWNNRRRRVRATKVQSNSPVPL